MEIERFFLIANREKDKDQALSFQIKEYLASKGKVCNIAYTDMERRQMRAHLRGTNDCLLVLGGDGTVLEAAHLTAGTGTPILGINLGNVGYLAEEESRGWKNAMRRLLDGDFFIESRMMLEGFVTDSKRNAYPNAFDYALNDIVITRNRGLQVLEFNVFVDGRFLNRYHADGMIVSTATGSTAYNMSAGGPIVEPTARMILLTPISPHTLNNRSIILSADDRITIEMISPRHTNEMYAECDFDGSTRMIDLHGGDRVNITKSNSTTRVIKLNELSFLETLHRKISS